MSTVEPRTHDLQIYIGRVPGEQPVHCEGIPSLIVAEGSFSQTRDVGKPEAAVLNNQDDLPMYIIVANSTVVEVVRFPFPSDVIVKMIRKLTNNQARLQECVAFGAQLFDFLFQRSIRDIFRRYEDKVGTVRITLATAIPELAYVPWELLCDTCPGELPRFLSYQNDVHLIRSLRLFNRAEFAPVALGNKDNELRILLVTASPDSLGHIDFLKEEQMLRFVLDELAPLEKVRLEVVHGATVQSLRSSLLSFRPHVVHMACHGGYDPKDDLGFVALASAEDAGATDLINSYRFATLMQEPESVQLVFVNTCYGAFQSSESAFSGIAQCLHAIGVADVVALQFFLLDTTAHAIVLNFYRYLLREHCTVEDSVTRVRRDLFMNGYIFPESFGLTMYQTNATLGLLAPGRAEPDLGGSIGFSRWNEMFDEKFEQAVMSKVSAEIDRLGSELNQLESLSKADIVRAITGFENQTLLAVRILQQIHKAGVSPAVFLDLLDLARKLAHGRYEGHPVQTGLLLTTAEDFAVYQSRYKVEVGEPLEGNLFAASIKDVLTKAIRVDGQRKTFIVTNDGESGPVKWAILTFKPAAIESDAPMGDSPWAPLAHSTGISGCAIAVLGDSSPRLKIFIGGWQAAEYCGGAWCHANHKDIRDGFINLAHKTELKEELMLHVMKKCLAASDRRRGLSLIVQRKDEILPRCHGGYSDVSKESDAFGLRDRNIAEIPDKEYLDAIAGDNAVILSAQGRTLAYHAVLAPQESTVVVPIKGGGSRHLSAQKITKETDAVAIVVSVDGPVTIFVAGNVEQRYLL